jgi:hypothetical protein
VNGIIVRIGWGHRMDRATVRMDEVTVKSELGHSEKWVESH